MPTITASGASVSTDSTQAATEATRQALRALGTKPRYGFLFASPKHDLGAALAAAREVASGAEILGCTTAGEITERGLMRGGMSVFLLAPDNMSIATASATGLKSAHLQAARDLCEPFAAASAQARAKGWGYSTTVTLMDGLCGTGEKIVSEIVMGTHVTQQVVGGAAGDDGAFKATHVGSAEGVGTDTAVALHAFGPKPWGVGVGHGLAPSTKKMTVTKAKGNVIYELDGRPAFEAYKEHAKARGASLDPKTAGEYLIGNELGIFLANQVHRARAPLAVGDDGSLACAADVPQGAAVCILDGEPVNMIAAAKSAAAEALENLEGAKPAGVLLFDCICRGMILKDEFQKEIDAVRGVLGDVPVAGFLTYGEIANYRGKVDGWHNTTAVVVAIPA